MPAEQYLAPGLVTIRLGQPKLGYVFYDLLHTPEGATQDAGNPTFLPELLILLSNNVDEFRD